MKKPVIAVAAVAVVITATAAWNQGRMMSHGPGGMGRPIMSCPAMAANPLHPGMLDRMSKPLGLSKSQVTKLKSITSKNDKTIESLRQQSAKASRALHDAMFASKYSASKTRALAAKAGKSEVAVISASINEWSEIRSVLTSTQTRKLQQAMERDRPGPGGPMMGGFPPPPWERR